MLMTVSAASTLIVEVQRNADALFFHVDICGGGGGYVRTRMSLVKLLGDTVTLEDEGRIGNEQPYIGCDLCVDAAALYVTWPCAGAGPGWRAVDG